ncbi:hypothetical protein [Clostridium estertheticum]|uniref:hypothetical protein n=1 Tax=Clostridium estertheticum TaxID=238834 RepID=UPI001C0BF52B|nr:hypothetical protein [Clostridium estertheticum]MBU3173368.1 hypothetical protein [Clostridium estertheticum]
MFKKIDFKKLKYRLKYFLSKGKVAEKNSEIKGKVKDTDMKLTNKTIRIYNHGFEANTIFLGCAGSGKVRSYVMPTIPNTKEKIEDLK